jgi:MYXO-CTERM domain-containing protein
VCVDSGTSVGAPATDILGVARPINGDGLNAAEFDMGAYEYAPSGFCGDGVIGAGEICDSGAQNGTYGNCKADCSGAGPKCGDGITNGHEACDDGNASDLDDCLSTCKIASCGDGFVHVGVEECDDANGVAGDGCTPQCMTEGKSTSSGAATGAGGAGGEGSETTSSVTGAGGGGPSGPATSGGCGCRTAGGESEESSTSWLALAAAAIVVARRRRSSGSKQLAKSA